MNFIINCNQIFFDRFSLSGEEKLSNAKYILNKALSEKNISFSIENNIIFVEESEEFYPIADIIKREFFILLERVPEKTEKISLIDQITDYIETRYSHESFCVKELCDRFEIKRSVLDNLFVKHTNKTSKEYIKCLRIEKAKTILKEGEKVNVVYEKCGFGTEKTMQRAFKDVYNISPSEWRLLDRKIIE